MRRVERVNGVTETDVIVSRQIGDGRVPRDFRFTHRTAERGKPFRYSVSKKPSVVSTRIINKQDFQTDTLRNAR